MANIKSIRTERDYDAALARISDLMETEGNDIKGDELDVLVDLVELYESKHVTMGYPDPIAAIEFRMEQAGLQPRDLVPFLGSRAKVSEVLSGKRAITMSMARALYEHLGIPADVLLQKPDVGLEDPLAVIDWGRFPIKSMAKLGWIPDRRNLTGCAEQIMRDFFNRAGGMDVVGAALFRKNNHVYANAKTDPFALRAWCCQVLLKANEDRPRADYESGTVNLDFLARVGQQSWSENGPQLAKELLNSHGISLIIERRLPRTYLDGAALQLGDGRPVIGLTLRYDRIDNFWFCLLHELAHVGRHMDSGRGEAFIDDFSLRRNKGDQEDSRECQADEWAEEALIPSKVWEASSVRNTPTPMAVMNLANSLKVHPAIVAGKVRFERQNYRLLSQFVGTGEIRRQIEACT